MCLFKAPKVPPPPKPVLPADKNEEELRERRRLARRQGPFISPYALAPTSVANPTPQKTLLGT